MAPLQQPIACMDETLPPTAIIRPSQPEFSNPTSCALVPSNDIEEREPVEEIHIETVEQQVTTPTPL
ncbi:hypothetical protein Ancab_017219, partial [Ancistrocladus abbreviatus]